MHIGADDDPAETEADRTAHSIMQGGGCTCSAGAPLCPACASGGAAPVLRRKAEARGANAAAVGNLQMGAGRRLGESERGFFEARMGADLSAVRVHDDERTATTAKQINARAFTLGTDVGFARGAYQPNTSAGRELLAHELAHVMQQSAAPPPAGGTIRRKPDTPEGAPAPVSARIAETDSTGVPGSTSTKITLEIPAFGNQPKETRTLVVNEKVLGASLVTVYAVPSEDLYPSPEAAAEARGKSKEDRKALSLAANAPKPLEKQKTAPAPSTTAATTPATTVPADASATDAKAADTKKTAASADTPGTDATSGVVRDAGPSPGSDVEVAYDINGHKIGIIERSAGWGLTTEYTKLAVGAAAFGIERTPSGLRLIDAGVKHTGSTVDADMLKRAVERLKEVAQGERVIRDIAISHGHLDHIDAIDAVSKEFIIERVTINALQIADPRLALQMQNVAKNQQELLRRNLADKFNAERATWMGKEGAAEFPEPGAREGAFKDWVNKQVELELATAKPIDVHVAIPAGSTINAADVKIGGIEIKPHTASAEGPKEGYVANDPFRTTLLDPDFKTKYDEYIKELAKNPDAKFKGLDAMSSSYLMKLPNGNHLIVIPDIRTGDMLRMQDTLVKEFAKLGAPVEFRVWDMTHHMQEGWVSVSKDAGTKATPEKVTVAEAGALRASQLAEMTTLLTKLTGARGKGGGPKDVVSVSVNLAKVDPALLYLLRSCGFEPILAHSEMDVQFIEAITASGLKIAGLTQGSAAAGPETEPLMRRTDIALEDLRKSLDETTVEANKELADQKTGADALEKTYEPQRQELQREISNLKNRLGTAEKNIDTPSRAASKKSLATRTEERDALANQIDNRQRELDALRQEVKDLRELTGPKRSEQARLKEEIKSIEGAKKAVLQKLSTHAAPEGTPLATAGQSVQAHVSAEEKTLADLIDPAYHEAIKTEKVARITETSLIVLGKDVPITDANRELLETWRQAEALRGRIDAGDLPLHAHGELIEKLGKLKELIAARPDISGQAAVEDEVAFIDKQIENSRRTLEGAGGEKTLSRDPNTGLKVETSVIRETATTDAQEGKSAPETTEKKAEPGAGEPAGKPELPKSMQKGLDLFGRGMGGVMIYQNIKGSTDALTRYGQNEANAAETSLALTKSALGITVGYRMLRGAHVGMGEFVVISVIDVAQTALGTYESSAEWNTEVTYALVSNAVSLALSAVGMALIETANPVGVIAGLAVMFLGDPLLEWLGVHDWLAKKFAFMPDEYIEVQTELDSLIRSYRQVVGAIELGAITDATLKKLGAKDAEAVHSAAMKVVESRRVQLSQSEREILAKFTDAYARARKGYAGLKELDDLRYQFLTLYNRAHQDDEHVEGAGSIGIESETYGGYSPVTRTEVADAFADVEKDFTTGSISVLEVAGMEQWTRMDDEIESLVGELYHSDYEDIDWMKVSEYEHNLDLMIANARYRLEPKKQGRNRATAMFAPGTPEYGAYAQLLAARENKLDVLRERQLRMAMHSHPDTGKIRSGEVTCDSSGCMQGPDVYHEPEWGAGSSGPDTEKQLALLETIVLWYINAVIEMEPLPGNLTVEDLYSSKEKLAEYRTAIKDDGDYMAALFALRGSRSSTAAALDRAHRLLDSRDLTAVQKQRLKKADADWRSAEEDRLVEHGYLFFEEIDPLARKMVATAPPSLARALGEAENTDQLSDEQREALKTPELSQYKLSTLSDRVTQLGLTLPANPGDYVPRVYRLNVAPTVLVAREWENFEEYIGEESAGETKWSVTPLNSAAIAYYGSGDNQLVGSWGLAPVTRASLVESANAKH